MLKPKFCIVKSIAIILTFAFSFKLHAAFGYFSHAQPQSQVHTQWNGAIKGLDPYVLKMALKAHAKAKSKAKNPSVLTVIDYSKPSSSPRLWVLDLNNKKVLAHTFVAHGKGSGVLRSTQFSDKVGSKKSSLGLFITGRVYNGKHGPSLRLHGLEKGFNGQAYSRAVVVHSAPYVSQAYLNQKGRLGLSWGCPVLDEKVSDKVIQIIKNGTLIFSFYPDKKWLTQSKYLA